MDSSRNIKNAGNKPAVSSMFDRIAFRYDFLNHLLSFGIDRCWRKKAIRIISENCPHPVNILDVATGTGDLAIAAVKLNPVHITGIDISREMLKAGRKKIKRKGLTEKIELIECDSEKMTFNNENFDVAMVAFGVRNFSDPIKGLSEMARVLRKGGIIIVLEFSKPGGFFFGKLYTFYFHRILPVIGKIISRESTAYRYLPDSVLQFPDNERFVDMLKQTGFTSVRQKKLTGGVVSIYTGFKF
jgi:demethylmenaquinone methyltransferase/2-methoxy-6-polyprenyl-1,4-benzoquinol methylase